MLDRFDGDVLPFGSSATGTERTIFGDVMQSDDINDNINTSYFRGWGIIGVNDVPTKQDFNAMAYTNSYLTSYLYQQGIPTWNTNQKYYLYSRCIGSNGKQYKAKTGTLATPNVGNNPVSDATNWEEDSSELDINSLTNKTTPANTDNLVLQETGGLLKKLSWSNLKSALTLGFNASFATNGYIKFPDLLGGFIIQWGSVSAGVSPITYPLAFPNNALYSIVQPQINNGGTASWSAFFTGTLTQTSFTRGNSGPAAIWIAIGN